MGRCQDSITLSIEELAGVCGNPEISRTLCRSNREESEWGRLCDRQAAQESQHSERAALDQWEPGGTVIRKMRGEYYCRTIGFPIGVAELGNSTTA